MWKKVLTLIVLTFATSGFAQSWFGAQARWDPVSGLQLQTRLESGFSLGDWYLGLAASWASRDPSRFWLSGVLWIPLSADQRVGLEVGRSLDASGFWRVQVDYLWFLGR